MTLLELMVALAVMAIVAALVTPAWRTPERHDRSFGTTVRHARELSTRRGEALLLTVASDGSWELRAATGSEDAPLERGALGDTPEHAFALELTPLGGCVPRSALPHDLEPWDAGRCAVDSLSSDVR